MGNKEDQNKNTLGAVVAGMAVGAAAAALANKDNRDKLRAKAEEIKEKGKEKLSQINETVQREKEVLREKLGDEKDEIEDELASDTDM